MEVREGQIVLGGASGRFGAGEEGLPWNQPGSGTVSTFGKGYNAYASKTTGFGTANAGFKGGKGGLGSGQSFGTNPGFGKSFTVQKAASLDYKEGDRVPP